MKTTIAFAFSSLVLGFTSTAHAATVTFDWATIGDPGNAGDVQSQGTFGAVTNTYRISKTAVTNTQYAKFLNAVAAADPNGLYSTSMGSDTRGGITRSGSSGDYMYAVKADSIGNGPGGADGDDYTYGSKPVVYVSFFDSMRFTNWLENGQATGAQDASTTEAGSYTIGSGADEVRNSSATYFVPSEDEWYKAAYYAQNKEGGAGYYDYPTSTDTPPDNSLPSADTGNSANFTDGGAQTTGDFFYPMTDVGAYAMSESPYGTFDQGGNVREWNESLVGSALRGIRGGSWSTGAIHLAASTRFNFSPVLEFFDIGFRVATAILEPTTLDGDYNGDGIVDAADYTVWRDSLNSTTDLAADGDGSGVVDIEDYNLWKGNFGAISATPTSVPASATSTSVPEPTTLLMCGLALGAMTLRQQRVSQ